MSAPVNTLPERTLAADLVSDEAFPLPDIEEFYGEFLPDESLDALLAAIRGHFHAFDRFRGLNIKIFWQNDAGKEEGRIKIGSSSKQNSITRYLANVDWVIFVNHKAAAQYGLTNWQMEACVFHQLMHIEVEHEGDAIKLKTHPHDIGLFHAEVINYGAWYFDLKNTARSFEQAGLWDDSPAESSEDLKAIPPLIPNRLESAIELVGDIPNAIAAGDEDGDESDQDPEEDPGVDDADWEEIDENSPGQAGPPPDSIESARAKRSRIINGETFHVDDLGRYVSDDSGEILDPTDVPLASTGGR